MTYSASSALLLVLSDLLTLTQVTMLADLNSDKVLPGEHHPCQAKRVHSKKEDLCFPRYP